MTSPHHGDFGFRTVVGSFRPDVSEMYPSASYFGLQQQVQYVYAFLKTPSGPAVVQRKFMGSMTGGAYIMNTKAGYLSIDPATGRTARGEVRMSIDDKHRRYFEPLSLKWPTGAAPEGEQPLEIEIRDRHVTWSEGDLCISRATWERWALNCSRRCRTSRSSTRPTPARPGGRCSARRPSA